MTEMRTSEIYQEAHDVMNLVERELIHNVVMEEADRIAVVASVCLGQSVLFEGAPGTGKTTIAKTLATAIGGDYQRVQGTDDLIPSDLTGIDMFDRNTSRFEFMPGPLLRGNVVLLDEMNRMPGRSQSALLQAMEEHEVTVGNATYSVQEPFIVIATENEVAKEQGNYETIEPLRDRFSIGVKLSELSDDQMIEVVNLDKKPQRIIDDPTALDRISKELKSLPHSSDVQRHAARIITSLRSLSEIDKNGTLLSGARPLIHILGHAAAQTIHEDVAGNVRTEHVERAARYVLPHRIRATYTAREEGKTTHDIVDQAIRTAAPAK